MNMPAVTMIVRITTVPSAIPRIEATGIISGARCTALIPACPEVETLAGSAGLVAVVMMLEKVVVTEEISGRAVTPGKTADSEIAGAGAGATVSDGNA